MVGDEYPDDKAFFEEGEDIRAVGKVRLPPSDSMMGERSSGVPHLGELKQTGSTRGYTSTSHLGVSHIDMSRWFCHAHLVTLNAKRGERGVARMAKHVYARDQTSPPIPTCS